MERRRTRTAWGSLGLVWGGGVLLSFSLPWVILPSVSFPHGERDISRDLPVTAWEILTRSGHAAHTQLSWWPWCALPVGNWVNGHLLVLIGLLGLIALGQVLLLWRQHVSLLLVGSAMGSGSIVCWPGWRGVPGPGCTSALGSMGASNSASVAGWHAGALETAKAQRHLRARRCTACSVVSDDR